MVSFRWIAIKIFAATTIVSGFFLLGFLWHKYDLPQSRKIEWMERKLEELAGYPSAIEDSLSRIESTFIRFSGTIYPLPDSDGTAGGAMTLWDDDLIDL